MMHQLLTYLNHDCHLFFLFTFFLLFYFLLSTFSTQVCNADMTLIFTQLPLHFNCFSIFTALIIIDYCKSELFTSFISLCVIDLMWAWLENSTMSGSRNEIRTKEIKIQQNSISIHPDSRTNPVSDSS